MDMEASQHQENMANASLENMLVCTNGQQDGKKPRPQPEQALKCPRCDSTNTKFCYYNNYSLTQPRYFCKSCRRYWTKGGTLRNVPVGGGCRKNKRSSVTKRTPDQIQPNPLTGIPPALSYDAGDHLSLAFARLQKSGGQLGFDNEIEVSGIMGNPGNTHGDINSPVTPGFLDTMRSGFVGNNNNFQNFCYGFGTGNIGGDRNVGGDMMVPAYEYDQDSSRYNGAAQGVTAGLMKQEFASNVGKFDGANFPYYGGNVNVGEFENGGRESWNGINASWHGLLNSPLMM